MDKRKIIKIILIFMFFPTKTPARQIQAACSLIGTWNDGNPDKQLNDSNITNKMVACDLPKRDKHDIERQDLGLLANNTNGINSITYSFKTGNHRREETINRDDIVKFISRHNLNLEDILPDNHPNRRDEYVRLLLKELKGIDNASSVTIKKGGIKLLSGTNIWADNGKGFAEVEVGYNFEFESCLYTGKRTIWYCTERGCTETNLSGKTETQLKVCQAPVSCIGIDGALHESEATCMAYGEGNCPPPSLCAKDIILKRLTLGSFEEGDSSETNQSGGVER